MKKTLKILTSLTLSIVMLTSLCSCINIKELRRSQGYYTDETQKSILFNGKIYDLMEDWNDDIDVFLTEVGSVSEKGKPLLIANLTGDTLHYNDAEIIIQANYSNYCLREEYENMTQKIANMKLENYCVKSWCGDGFFEEVEEEIIILDDEYVEAINYILENVTPSDDEEVYFEESVTVSKCDDTKTFLEYFCTVGRTYESRYYIETYGYTTINDEYIEGKTYYILPSQAEPFKKLIDEGNNHATHKYYY